MIQKIQKSNEKYGYLRNFFTTSNKGLERLEKMQGRKMPWLRQIKLFSEDSDGTIYVPPGQFPNDIETSKHNFSKEFVGPKYDEKITDPALLESILEQDSIVADIAMSQRSTGLIEMKTGRGKSFLIMKLIELFQKKSLVLCHNIKTMHEMQKKIFEQSGIEPTLYYGKKKEIGEITITTHASFMSARETFNDQFGIIFYDECDKSLISTKGNMLRALCRCSSLGLFGLTGTPFREDINTDDMTLIFGTHYKIREQSNNGYNIIPDITILKYKNTEAFSYDNYNDMREQVMEDKVRLAAQMDLVEKVKPTVSLGLMLVDRIKECDTYYELLTERGIPCGIIRGETTEEEDKETIAYCSKNNGIIVGTVGKMSRGVDIPMIDTVFLFAPMRFHGSVIQAVGRALRSHPGKDGARLYDWNDSMLSGQARQRKSIYPREYPNCKIVTEVL